MRKHLRAFVFVVAGSLFMGAGEKEQQVIWELDNLEEIGWDRFFEVFEAQKLAFLHQDLTEDGQPSRFNKFVDRD